VPVMAISSHESLRVAARSTPVPVAALTPAPDSATADPTADEIKAGIKKAHDQLTAAIGYTPALAAGTENAIVGIAEKLESVNRDHPQFIEDGRSAWWEILDDTSAQAHRPPDAASAAAALTLARLSEDEHGTHVAGIIGARPSSIAPGLVPAANLVLIPTNTANSLNAGIELASKGSLAVKVFNLSFIFESGQFDAPLLDDLQRMMRIDWKDKLLFVVAAGNGGKDLNTETPPAPVSWIPTTPNILSVGATRADGSDLLGQHSDPGEAAHSGSNFGSKFVHLVAPGERVHSLGKDSYAFACGTSQAAPQVSAAAAMLVAQNVIHPREIKARLMYTADWLPQYADRVQAGRLNVKRAVRLPSLNLVQMFSDGKWFSLKPIPDSHIVVTSGRQFKNGVSEPIFKKRFDFARVLSLIHLQGSQFRMFALTPSDEFVSVIGELDTNVKIRCAGLQEYDNNDMQVMTTPATKARCTSGIPVSQIKEYIAQTGSAGAVVF
jgi:subtilisin family serine protease